MSVRIPEIESSRLSTAQRRAIVFALVALYELAEGAGDCFDVLVQAAIELAEGPLAPQET